jgi:oxygen-independent coproporphyrinogen-3 oxidase
LEFHDDFNEKAYINQLQNADSSRPISLYFHLPFCRSACYFCGCNVIYTSKLDKMDLYINYLEKELIILSKYLDTSRVVSQLHFGGGTPTFFSPLQLSRVYELSIRHFLTLIKMQR